MVGLYRKILRQMDPGRLCAFVQTNQVGHQATGISISATSKSLQYCELLQKSYTLDLFPMIAFPTVLH